jgi:threonine dehydratase
MPRPTGLLPTLEDVQAAQRRLRPFLAPTPLVPSPALGPDVLLKLETEQPTGSFKVRGALAALTALPPGERVVAASAGNHALGIAWAAERLGLDATVVCAETASPAKIAALRQLPAELVLHGTSYDDAERHALRLADSGMRFVSAYNDPDVVAGAGTLMLELLAEVDGGFTAVTPVGGGGLVSGVGLAATARSRIRVVGVEAEASRALSASVAAGHVVEVDVASTLADGLAGNLEAGSITVELARRHVAAFTAVSEEELAEAVRFLHAEHGLVAEGAGAAGVAAVLAGRVEAQEGQLVCLVTGRNITVESLAAVLANIEMIDR